MKSGTEKSLKINMALNVLKGVLGILFPLISFPYASRILGVENIGKINFVNSVVSYFVLFSGLGINMYAISEGPKIRNNRIEFEKFASSIFSINIIAASISFILLVLSVYLIPKFSGYPILFVILSTEVLLSPLGVEWIFSIYEDYLLVTIRGIVFNIIHIVLLFTFVHSERDLLVYAALTAFSVVGVNIFNFIFSRKYCSFHFTLSSEWKKHIRTIFLLFATNLTISLYVSSDTTILGFLCNDEIVGYYSVSTKVYSIVKSIVASIVAVSIPRIATNIGEKTIGNAQSIINETYSTLMTIVAPSVVGVVILRDEIVEIIAGKEFARSSSSLAILGVALFFCMGAYFWGQAILVPNKRGKILFYSTLLSALLNVGLNFLLIPHWHENAAAFTTVIAEASCFFICRCVGRQYATVENLKKMILQIFIGCIFIVVTCTLVRYIEFPIIVRTLISVFISAFGYFTIQILFKNEAIFPIFKKVAKLIKNNRRNDKKVNQLGNTRNL